MKANKCATNMNPLFLSWQKKILSEMAISHCFDSKFDLWRKISQMEKALVLKEAFFTIW